MPEHPLFFFRQIRRTAENTARATAPRIRISQIFISFTSSRTQQQSDQADKKRHNPGNAALPEHDIERPFHAHLPFD